MKLTILKLHIAAVSLLLPLIDKLLPLKWLLAVMKPPRWLRTYKNVKPDTIDNYISKTIKKPRQMKRRKCVRRALLLFHFLRLAGCDATLNMSVGQAEGKSASLHGHFWVSTADGWFKDPPPEAMQLIMSYPAKPASGNDAGK